MLAEETVSRCRGLKGTYRLSLSLRHLRQDLHSERTPAVPGMAVPMRRSAHLHTSPRMGSHVSARRARCGRRRRPRLRPSPPPCRAPRRARLSGETTDWEANVLRASKHPQRTARSQRGRNTHMYPVVAHPRTPALDQRPHAVSASSRLDVAGDGESAAAECVRRARARECEVRGARRTHRMTLSHHPLVVRPGPVLTADARTSVVLRCADTVRARGQARGPPPCDRAAERGGEGLVSAHCPRPGSKLVSRRHAHDSAGTRTWVCRPPALTTTGPSPAQHAAIPCDWTSDEDRRDPGGDN